MGLMEIWESARCIIWWFQWALVCFAYLMVLFEILIDLLRDRDLNV